MENICNYDSLSIFGIRVSEQDISDIADTLQIATGRINVHEVKSILKDHWSNMLQCIHYSVRSESNFLLTRNEVFDMANNEGLLKTYHDKGDLIHGWAREMFHEIEQGKLTQLSRFKLQTISSGSISGNFNGKKYNISFGTLRKFFKTAREKIDSFNDKAYSAIDEFVSWARDRSIDKPWSSPLFIFVIILLVLFTLSATTGFDLSIGIFSVLYKVITKLCLLCSLHFGGKHVYHLAKEFLGDIGLGI